MASQIDICNQALGHLNVSTLIEDIDEGTSEANACRLFYDPDLRLMLRSFQWPSHTKKQALQLVEELTDEEYAYSYQYPNDCVEFRRIMSGTRQGLETNDTKVPWKIVRGETQRLIYTDTSEAVGEYTVVEDNPEVFHPDFVKAFSYLLAASIAPRITGGDPMRLADKCLSLYQYWMSFAVAKAATEDSPGPPPDSEFERSRR